MFVYLLLTVVTHPSPAALFSFSPKFEHTYILPSSLLWDWFFHFVILDSSVLKTIYNSPVRSLRAYRAALFASIQRLPFRGSDGLHLAALPPCRCAGIAIPPPAVSPFQTPPERWLFAARTGRCRLPFYVSFGALLLPTALPDAYCGCHRNAPLPRFTLRAHPRTGPVSPHYSP